jgi:N6-adenosine-specific RNA methylase IME4
MRTLKPGRTQVNLITSRKQEHSRKPDEFYNVIEGCSPGPYLELFARFQRPGWVQWGNEVGDYELRRPELRGYTRPLKSRSRDAEDGQSIFSLAVQAKA